MKRRSTKRSAFTLMELLVVLVLVALVVAMVAVNLGGPLHSALAEQAIGRWIVVDRQMRQHSAKFRRPAELSFELKENQLKRIDLQRKKPIGSVVQLPARVRIDRYVSTSKNRSLRRGKVAIHFSPYGQTNSYAVLLAGPGEQQTWLLFLGVTGEIKRGLGEAEVHEALRLASS